MLNTSVGIPLKFTIIDFSNSLETGEVVKCALDVANRQTVEFKFGLNADTPQDITNSLTSATNIHENSTQFAEIVQNVILYINQNKHSQSIRNIQFTAILNGMASEKNVEVKKNPAVQEVTNINNNMSSNDNYAKNNHNVSSDNSISAIKNTTPQFVSQQQQNIQHQPNALSSYQTQQSQQQQQQIQLNQNQQQTQPSVNFLMNLNSNSGVNTTNNMNGSNQQQSQLQTQQVSVFFFFKMSQGFVKKYISDARSGWKFPFS